jgi:hypothetical protein
VSGEVNSDSGCSGTVADPGRQERGIDRLPSQLFDLLYPVFVIGASPEVENACGDLYVNTVLPGDERGTESIAHANVTIPKDR